MRRQKAGYQAPLLLAVMALAGCATSGPAIQPAEVTLDRIDVEHVGVGKQSLKLGFSVTNPNPFPLPVRAIRYELRLGNQKVARGETADRFVVAARGDGEFAIGVELDVLDSISQLGFGVLKEQIEYELYGSLTVDLPFAQPVAFSSSGQFALR
jgi:LEA14-like dessication related protein